MPDRTAQTNPGLSLPDDLVLALNLSRTDRAVLNTIAAHRWTFTDDAQAWQGALQVIGAEHPGPTVSMTDIQLLAACVHSERARRTLCKLDQQGGVAAGLLFYASLPAQLAESLCGISRLNLFSAESIPRARGWLAVGLAARVDDPIEVIRAAAQPAIADATEAMRSLLHSFGGDLRDLHTTLDDLHVLAACLRSPKARRTMHKLQLHAAIPASRGERAPHAIGR